MLDTLGNPFDGRPLFAYAVDMPIPPTVPLLSSTPVHNFACRAHSLLRLGAVIGLALWQLGCADIASGTATSDAAQGDSTSGSDTSAVSAAFEDELYALPGECEDPGQWVRTMFVLDGDTLLLDDGLNSKVRLLGVAAPEIAHGAKSAECYGVKAWTLVKQWLVVEQFAPEDARKASELPHMYVCVRPDPGADNKDDFGRLLRYVYLRDVHGKAVQLNARLIRQGAARVYTAFSKGLRDKAALQTRETAARNEGLGGWSQCKWSPR